MGIFSKLFGKREEPVRIFEHPVLGSAEWSEEDEAWIGKYNGIAYLLAYDCMSVPIEALTKYAVEMLNNRQELLDSVESAKVRAARECPAFYTEEIGGLKLGNVLFYQHKNCLRIFADLEGGLDFRAWRIEYRGRTCEGIGFDS